MKSSLIVQTTHSALWLLHCPCTVDMSAFFDCHTSSISLYLLLPFFLPLVLSVLQHLLPPQVKEVGWVSVELQSLLPIIPTESIYLKKESIKCNCKFTLASSKTTYNWSFSVQACKTERHLDWFSQLSQWKWGRCSKETNPNSNQYFRSSIFLSLTTIQNTI